MRKLIKADLTGILELVPVYQPVEEERIEQAIANLECGDAQDYLFLSRRGLCRLSTMAAAYDRNNFANSDWLAFRGMNLWPIIALFLHVDEVVDKRPWGSVKEAANLVRGCLRCPEVETQFDTRLTTRLRGSRRSLPPFCHGFEPQKNDKIQHLAPEYVFFIGHLSFCD